MTAWLMTPWPAVAIFATISCGCAASGIVSCLYRPRRSAVAPWLILAGVYAFAALCVAFGLGMHR